MEISVIIIHHNHIDQLTNLTSPELAAERNGLTVGLWKTVIFIALSAIFSETLDRII